MTPDHPGASRSPRVAVVMGSASDLAVMAGAVEMLRRFEVAHEVRVVSAHRTPEDMVAYGAAAAGRGLQVIIAGAGGAAHLPGMLAAVTTLPVIGVPVALANLDGLDSLLSIVQMPRGVPVATVAVNGARNAGVLAARILGLSDPDLARALEIYRGELADQARAQNAELAEGLAPDPG
jgi:5-(carboxyamino)imidazole ribonucleotide mutase